MTLPLHIARTVFVSLEMLAIAICVFVWLVAPRLFEWLDTAMKNVDWLWLISPFGVLGSTALGLVWKILFPKDNVSDLISWPEYPKLRATALVGVVFTLLGAVAASIGVLGRELLPTGLASLLLTCGYAVSAISCFSMLTAALVVRSIAAGGN